jgi:hypothetical protein
LDAAEPPATVIVESEAQAPPPAAEVRERGPAPKPLDVGATTFLLGGVAASGVVGLSAFVDDSLSSDVFVRLSAAGGSSASTDLSTTLAAGRVDVCYAFTGNYARGQGMRFGACWGADAGAVWIGAGTQKGEPQKSQSMAFVDMGPSVELGAEVGPEVTIVLRAGVGINLARDPYLSASNTLTDPSLANQRAEIGFSWKLR